eukprot:m.198862 g.198862  ORF g.198862 m.198862 type:complete len:1034 (-) comp32710_c1_seq1:139-3240(-)
MLSQHVCRSGFYLCGLVLSLGVVVDVVSSATASSSSVIFPIELQANYRRGLFEAPTLELSWSVGMSSGAKGFEHEQSKYQLKIGCHANPNVKSTVNWVELTTQTTASPKWSAQEFEDDVNNVLVAHSKCSFSVRLWDGHGQGSDWANPISFVTIPPNGTLDASWITEANAAEDTATTLLRKQFTTPGAPKSAVISISGLGHYELSLNGQRVGDHMMDPGWTKYTVNGTCLFSTYDVTSMIKADANMIGVFIGNGMYNNVGSARYAKWTGSAGPRTLAFLLTLVDTTGKTTTIKSDTTWEGMAGPITFNGVYGGEDHDARDDDLNWDMPQLSTATSQAITSLSSLSSSQSNTNNSWVAAVLSKGPGCKLGPQLQPPVKIREQMALPSVAAAGGGVFVYDFKQEFSGWPVLRVQGKAGSVIRMTPAEFTTSDGMPDQRFGPAYWQYTLRGTGEIETYRPKFFTYGFRYLKVEMTAGTGLPPNTRFITGGSTNVYFEQIDLKVKHHVGFCSMCGLDICSMLVHVPGSYVDALTLGNNFSCSMINQGTNSSQIESITGEFVYTSAALVGNFSCSLPLFNSIHKMIYEAMKSNLVGIFTDCPHRERLGWLEQSWLLAKAVGHNFDLSSLYSKIANDMAEAQVESGMVPDIAPEYVVFNGGFRDSPEWGIAFVMVPMYLFHEFNDTSTASRFYPGMVKYIDYLTSRADPTTGIVAYGLGDWVSDGDQSKIGVTATMVYLEGLQNMVELATALGNTDDAHRFKLQASKVIAGYNKVFLDSATHSYCTGSQTATAMAVTLGAAVDTNASLAWLVGNLQSFNNHSRCGEIGWPYVVRSLAQSNRDDVLEAIVSRTDAPSYGFQLLQGATTLTETWTASRGDSWNHAMLGHIDSWFFEHVGGLRSTSTRAPIYLKPQPVKGLEHAQVSRVLPTGTLAMRWSSPSSPSSRSSPSSSSSPSSLDQGSSSLPVAFEVAVTVPASAVVHLELPTTDVTQVLVDGVELIVAEHVRLLPSTTTDNNKHINLNVVLQLAPGQHNLQVAVL